MERVAGEEIGASRISLAIVGVNLIRSSLIDHCSAFLGSLKTAVRLKLIVLRGALECPNPVRLMSQGHYNEGHYRVVLWFSGVYSTGYTSSALDKET